MEFIFKVFKWFLKDHNIEKEMSIPYRPQQNGVPECANQTIVKMTNNMLYA